MKKFLSAHPNIIIGVLALIFVAGIFAFYSWGINDIFMGVRQALIVAPATQETDGFDLQGASKLDLHGLVSSSDAEAPQAPATTTATSSAPSSLAATTTASTTNGTTTGE